MVLYFRILLYQNLIRKEKVNNVFLFDETTTSQVKKWISGISLNTKVNMKFESYLANELKEKFDTN